MHQVRRISVSNTNYPLFHTISRAGSIANMPRFITFALCLFALATCSLVAQTSPAATQSAPAYDALAQTSSLVPNPITVPTLSPGVLLLMELEGRFEKAVVAGGGKAFGMWFADDAVTLNNGKPAVHGRAAIATLANWDPKTYQLTWQPQGAQMGPSNDMGFTWGHYEGHSKDKNGQPVVISGRYFTVWKKLPDGTWKVAMDASADEPPATGECCVLPKP
jgi:ketosteroid isomerase-like protein